MGFKMQKDNVSLQASEEVSYDTFIKFKKLTDSRERFYIEKLCNMIDETLASHDYTNLSILEIGFNDGSQIRELSKLYEKAVFTGLEVREKPVEDMVAAGYDCRLVKTELFDEFFKSGETFDIIYGFGVLHHMSDPYKTLESLLTLLNPGGALIFIREDHPYDMLAYIHTTVNRAWRYEKNKFKMNRKRFKSLLSRYTNNYYVIYDNNGIAPCFGWLNKVYCALRLQRVPFWNSMNIYAKLDKVLEKTNDNS
jgi:trans-aconitate methyltransferase